MDRNDRKAAGLSLAVADVPHRWRLLSEGRSSRLDRIGRKWTQIADQWKRGLVTVFCPPPTSTATTVHALKQLTISAGQQPVGMRAPAPSLFLSFVSILSGSAASRLLPVWTPDGG